LLDFGQKDPFQANTNQKTERVPSLWGPVTGDLMKILVIGSGKMGSVIAWDLCKYRDVETIGLVDTCSKNLEKAVGWIGDRRVKTHLLADNPRETIIELMKIYDTGVGALPTVKQGNELIEDAIEAGMNLVDIHGQYHRYPNDASLEGHNIPSGMSAADYGEILHKRALEKNITLLSCMGFAPGLTNLTLGHAIGKMDRAETAVARVGGIPARGVADSYPMKYMATWCWDQAIDCAMDKTRIIKDGVVRDVDAMSAYERFRFQQFGQDAELEAFITPGMDSLVYTRPQLKHCFEKTIRWPGYRDSMSFLKSCGFFDTTPVSFNGRDIVPRDFSARVMEPGLMVRNQDPDVSIMWNTVTGEKGGCPAQMDYHMWVESDDEHHISSMGRATAFPASIAAVMLGRGELTTRGVLAPEDAFDESLYKRMISELKKRNIIIQETVT
jgi:lysine 6-dehydrogenase